MSRAVALSLAVLCNVAAFSQFPGLPIDSLVDRPGRWANLVTAEASYAYNANTLYNELPWALYQGGFIDRDLRQRSMDAMGSKPRNTAGYVLTARVTWTGRDCFLDRRHWRPTVSVAHHEEVGMHFTDDLYQVTFFGNAAFEGKRADLGPSANTQIRYQTIGTGIQDDRSGSYVRLDLVNGQSISKVDVHWAGLYTGVDGRVLRASILGDFFQSDTAGSEFARTNGIGLAVSGRWATVVARSQRPIDLAFEVQDLGFARWNGNAVRIEKDTVIEYEGFEVANIFDLDQVLIGEQQLRDTFGLQYRTGGFTSLLPFQVGASATMELGHGWRGTAVIDQRYLPGYVPQLTVSGSRRCGSHALLGASLSYGGFGGLRVGLASRIRMGGRVLVSIGTPHVPGFFMGTTRGAGVSFGVSVGFSQSSCAPAALPLPSYLRRMNWLMLVIAGLFEVGFATCLGKARETNGSTTWWWMTGFFVCLTLSMYLLYKATQTLPIGTAYAVWTGIGAVGTALVGILIFKEPTDFWRLFFIFTLVASLVGLKVVTH